MISKKEVEHIADLSRLKFSEEELEKNSKDLSSIIGYIEKLKEVEVEGVNPTSHSIDVFNVFRKDEPHSFEEKLKEGYFKVKSVFK